MALLMLAMAQGDQAGFSLLLGFDFGGDDFLKGGS